jgi:phosphoenolpyruvate synthase/pyruvate phosphate dikinase
MRSSMRSEDVGLRSGQRAPLHRITRGFVHSDALLAVVIQRMVEADVSGVLFTAIR